MADFVVTPTNWRACPHRTWQKATPTFGWNVPGLAQGAVFPGDEAGHRCKLTGFFCEDTPDPMECPLYKEEE